MGRKSGARQPSPGSRTLHLFVCDHSAAGLTPAEDQHHSNLCLEVLVACRITRAADTVAPAPHPHTFCLLQYAGKHSVDRLNSGSAIATDFTQLCLSAPSKKQIRAQTDTNDKLSKGCKLSCGPASSSSTKYRGTEREAQQQHTTTIGHARVRDRDAPWQPAAESAPLQWASARRRSQGLDPLPSQTRPREAALQPKSYQLERSAACRCH